MRRDEARIVAKRLADKSFQFLQNLVSVGGKMSRYEIRGAGYTGHQIQALVRKGLAREVGDAVVITVNGRHVVEARFAG